MVEGSISIDVQLKGAGSIRTNMQKFKTRFRTASLRALKDVAAEFLRDTRPYVPILTGALLDSGRVEVKLDPGDAVDGVTVVYGGRTAFNIPYARFQHEEELHHPSLAAGGGPFAAKYLEKPFRKNSQFYLLLYEMRLEFHFESLA